MVEVNTPSKAMTIKNPNTGVIITPVPSQQLQKSSVSNAEGKKSDDIELVENKTPISTSAATSDSKHEITVAPAIPITSSEVKIALPKTSATAKEQEKSKGISESTSASSKPRLVDDNNIPPKNQAGISLLISDVDSLNHSSVSSQSTCVSTSTEVSKNPNALPNGVYSAPVKVKFGQLSPLKNPESVLVAKKIDDSNIEESILQAKELLSPEVEDLMEDGEIEDDLPPKILPTNAKKITDFNSVTYPKNLSCTFPIGSAELKYSVDFLRIIGDMIKLPPCDMTKIMEIIGDERNMRRSSSHQHGSHPPSISRQGSSNMSRNRTGGTFSGPSSGRSERNRAGRNSREGRDRSERGGRGARREDSFRKPTSFAPPSISQKPLQRSENAWVPVKKSDLAQDEATVKLVKGLLNKLTVENFSRISDKILRCEIINENILKDIIELIFLKALDEPNFGSMYARLCQFLMRQLPLVQKWIHSDTTQNEFRSALLRKCQIEFESSTKWTIQDDMGMEERLERRRNIHLLSAEEKMAIAEEDYQRAKAKRHSLGNTQFIGELYIHGMISEKIINLCILSLLKLEETNSGKAGKAKDPEEEEVETLCKLMTTVGKKLEESLSGAGKVTEIEAYFKHLDELKDHKALSSRIRFMVMDVIDLRRNKWVPRTGNIGPTSIAQVHKEAEIQKRKEERERLTIRSSSRRDNNLARVVLQPSRRGTQDARQSQTGSVDADGWTSVSRTSSGASESLPRTNSRTKLDKSHSSEKNEADVGSKDQNQYHILQRREGGENEQEEVDQAESTRNTRTTPLERLGKFYSEFKETLEVSELQDDLKKLIAEDINNTNTLIEALVPMTIRHLLDVNAKNLKQILLLFTYILETFDSAVIWDAFRKYLVDLEDDIIDFPNGFKNIAELLVPLYLSELLSIDVFISFSKPLLKYGGMLPVAPNFLAEFLLTMTSDELVEFLCTCSDLSSFWPTSGNFMLNEKTFNMWIEKKKLHLVRTVTNISKIALNSKSVFPMLVVL